MKYTYLQTFYHAQALLVSASLLEHQFLILRLQSSIYPHLARIPVKFLFLVAAISVVSRSNPKVSREIQEAKKFESKNECEKITITKSIYFLNE